MWRRAPKSPPPPPGEGRRPRPPADPPRPRGAAARENSRCPRSHRQSRAFLPRSSRIPSRPGPHSYPPQAQPRRQRPSPARGPGPLVRPPAPTRPPSSHLLSSPREGPEQLCQAPASHPPPSVLRPGPSRSLCRRRSPGRAEGTGRRERREEGRRTARQEEAREGAGRGGGGGGGGDDVSGARTSGPLGAACALLTAEAPSLP